MASEPKITLSLLLNDLFLILTLKATKKKSSFKLRICYRPITNLDCFKMV